MNCKNCDQQFEITDKDRTFYDKVGVPSPTFCPPCRDQRRIAFRNERNLYQRKCDLCDQQIISIYSPDKPQKIYCPDCWYGDSWNQLKTGRDFDFTRPFFEQFAELLKEAQLPSLYQFNNQNSSYINNAAYNKNCYLLFSSIYNEDCLYGRRIVKDKNCIDCLDVINCELCYNCTMCRGCYNCFDCSFSKSLTDCISCYYCHQCSDCIGCTNLVRKQYYIFNKEHSKEEYEKQKKELSYEEIKEKALVTKLTQPHKATFNLNTENCTGDYIRNSKNCEECYFVEDLEDCKYMWDASMCKDCMDVSIDDESELNYECLAPQEGYNCLFSGMPYITKYATYCYATFKCEHLFGCTGLHHKKYCILNKQYTKEEYKKLVQKIIEHMKATGEWGQFFPMEISPFEYRESLAQERYPLETKQEKVGQREHQQLSEDVLTCNNCNKNFKLVDPEKEFYKKNSLNDPKKCFECRHLERFRQINPRKLWDRSCTKCNSQIKTTYAPERPETIYCDKCYVKEIHS